MTKKNTAVKTAAVSTEENAKRAEIVSYINTAVNHKESRSVNAKVQLKLTGKRTTRNMFGHYTGSQAAKIDTMIIDGTFTREQIAAFNGTKKSRISAHVAHLNKNGFPVVTVDGKLQFDKSVDCSLDTQLKAFKTA